MGRGLRSTRSACWFIFALFPTAEPVHRLSWNSHNRIDKGVLATAWYCFKTRQTAIHMNLSVVLYYNSVNCDRPAECSAENHCLRWHWLTFQQPERKSSSSSSEQALWSGKEQRKQRARTSGEMGRGLRSTRSACWFIFALLPTAEPVHRLSWNSHNRIDKGILATAWYCFKTRQTAIHMNLSVVLYYNSVNCDRLAECSAENDCLRWHWLTFQQPERKSSSSSSDDDFRSGCRNVSQCHLKQSFSGLHSPGRSQFTKLWYDSWVQTLYSSIIHSEALTILPTHIFDFIYQNYRIVLTRFVDYYESLY